MSTKTVRTESDWAALFYLAGDVEALASSVQRDLSEILAASSSQEVAIVVQHDGPQGATRYLVPPRSSAGATEQIEPVEHLGRIDSGSAQTLANFLRWAFSVCRAERYALILGGLNALDPAQGTMGEDLGRSRVFTLCRDDSSGGYLDVVELGGVIRSVLEEKKREQLDLLAVDSCHTQFLELAYELEGRVAVLLTSQTEVAGEGWHYTQVLDRWRTIAQEHGPALSAAQLARALVPTILASYRVGGDDTRFAVSALDLHRLDDVARAFDTLCISLVQSLGEGLIWRGRQLIVDWFDSDQEKGFPAYDCGSFFIIFAEVMNAMADEAHQRWLATTLQRATGSGYPRFRAELADELSRRVQASVDPERVHAVIAALRQEDFATAGKVLLAEIDDAMKQRLGAWARGRFDTKALDDLARRAATRDREVKEAIDEVFATLPEERRVDFERMEDSIDTARRLARQARQAALMLLGDRALRDLPGFIEGATSREGMVLISATLDSRPGWPRWSGVSIYRPPRLDALMNESYQKFAFHGRVHWAALLGACNLIDHHARALWRLVSSLLATGGPGTRRDVLRRMTGADSVIWGFKNQFRAMAPSPALTLSLERRSVRREPTSPSAAESRTDENYLLRLESATGGAVITEQTSRVQPQEMERALRSLEELLAAPVSSGRAFKDLRSIGCLLGEDIFQKLGRTLEEEREAVLEENPDAAVHLQLQIPRELMRYPWELLYHAGDWLSERFAIGRQVFMETGLARRVPRRRQGRVRPLVIGDPVFDSDVNWSQLPGARAEAEQVAGWFERLREDLGEVIDFDRARDTRIHTRLTKAELRALLRDGGYDIIHFAGHGQFDPNDPETSAWLLSDGPLWALQIRNTLLSHPAPPWLVYANACEAAMESERRRYNGNVFGLATAFINQGVSAYIAPLWPIDDLLAQQIALEFYRQLLAERASLGEALRRAKSEARVVATPAPAEAGDATSTWVSLGWASLVLYGDPTEELFQALAGSDAKPQPSGDDLAPAPRMRRKTRLAAAARSFLHAPDHVVAQWADDPTALREDGTGGNRLNRARGGDAEDAGPVLELIEDGGLRRWRIRQAADLGTRGNGDAGRSDGLPGSPLPGLLADDRVRRRLPGRRGFLRVIGRWAVSGFKDKVTGLVREYDRDQVAKEGLLLVTASGSVPLQRENMPKAGADGRERVLVLVHGTFSKSQSPIEGLGRDFLDWARARYRAVLALDHWTLSKTPEENARLLEQQLRAIAPELLDARRLDFITHSRGGLVARSFTELLDHAGSVRDIVFLGTPNCGTDLANPENWGRMADALVNLTGVECAEVFGRLAGLLARLAVIGGEQQIPGLLAQNPLMAGVENSFLHKLQRNGEHKGVRHSLITAEFEPTPLIPNLKALWKAAKDAGVDASVDAFFQDANDLVVNTAHVWCVKQPPTDRARLPALFAPDRVLAFVPPAPGVTLPKGIRREIALGVHHCNLFQQTRARESLKDWLSAG